MDPAIEFVQEQPNPLVFLLGPKPNTDFLIKNYDPTESPKRIQYFDNSLIFYRLNFQSYTLDTKFSQTVLANTPTDSKKIKGLLSLNWLRKFRFLVFFIQ